MVDQLPPHDIEAEEAVLGALMIDGEAMDEVSTVLTNDDFYSERCKFIYESCLNLQHKMKKINQVTVLNNLRQRNKADITGGASFIAHLISTCPTAMDIMAYAEIVGKLGLSRRLVTAGVAISEMGYRADPDVETTLDNALKTLEGLRGSTFQHGLMTRGQAVDEMIIHLNDTDNGATSLPYLFKDMDNVAGGMNPGEYIIFAGRPSMGKTEIVHQLTEDLVGKGKHCLFVSLEMTVKGLMEREVQRGLQIPIKRMRQHQLERNEKDMAINFVCGKNKEPIWFLTGDRSTEEVIAYARQLHRKHCLDFIVIDYIQLLKDVIMGDKRNDAVSKASRNIKMLTLELDIPILVISQLNREVEGRADKRPMMSDLKESGALEQDADVLWLLFRDEYYSGPSSDAPGVCEAKMAKNRQLGPAKAVKLVWDSAQHKYHDLAKEGEL